MWVWSLGWEDPLTAAHSYILAWTIAWTEEPGRLHSMKLQRIRNDWATENTPPPTHTHTHTLCAYANPNHPVSHFPPCFPFVTISLISRSANLFLFFYLRSFVSFLIDSVSKRYQMIFIFLCLTSLSMINSRSSHVSANSIVSFFSYG